MAKIEYKMATMAIMNPHRNHVWNYPVTSLAFGIPIGLTMAASDSGHE